MGAGTRRGGVHASVRTAPLRIPVPYLSACFVINFSVRVSACRARILAGQAVQLGNIIVIQNNIGGSHVLLQVGNAARAWNRQHDRAVL